VSLIPARILARNLRVSFLLAFFIMIPLVFFFTSEGTWALGKNREGGGYNGRFFRAQAEAITHGRLDVPRNELQSECFDRDSRCYGYFGLTPSLLRLPFLPYLHWLRSALTPFYLGIAILLGYGAALRLLERALLEFDHPRTQHGAVLAYFVVGAITLGPGGTLLLLARPSVYDEAAAWGVAFLLMTLERVWAWYRTHKTRPLVLAVLFGVLAANAKPTAVTACAALGVLVAVLSRFTVEQAAWKRRRSVLVAAACLGLLPSATAAGVFWLKFRTPLPDLRLNEQIPESPWWSEILRINGDKTGGLVFLPTELVAYLRPDGVIWQTAWPYADFAFPQNDILWLPPLPRGGAYVERFATVTSTMPLAWAVNLIVLLGLGKAGLRSVTSRGRTPTFHGPAWTQPEWILATGLLASACAMIVLIVTTIGIVNRYLAEFFPISVVGFAFGHRVILPILGRGPLLRAIAAPTAVLLTGWSMVVTMLLTVRLVFW
jgi:hypothetical protein